MTSATTVVQSAASVTSRYSDDSVAVAVGVEHVAGDDRGTQFGHQFGLGGALPAGGAGDQDDLAVELGSRVHRVVNTSPA